MKTVAARTRQHQAVVAQVLVDVMRVDHVRPQLAKQARERHDGLRIQQAEPGDPALGIVRVDRVDRDALAVFQRRRAARAGHERDAMPGGDQPLPKLPGDLSGSPWAVGGERVAQDDDMHAAYQFGIIKASLA